MAWVDQREVATQHLALATAALERAVASPPVSPDVVEALEDVRAASIALAKLAPGANENEPPTKR